MFRIKNEDWTQRSQKKTQKKNSVKRTDRNDSSTQKSFGGEVCMKLKRNVPVVLQFSKFLEESERIWLKLLI